jgi:hypothetical protein
MDSLKIEVTSKECPLCDGSGYYVSSTWPFRDFHKCRACDGTGLKPWAREDLKPKTVFKNPENLGDRYKYYIASNIFDEFEKENNYEKDQVFVAWLRNKYKISKCSFYEKLACNHSNHVAYKPSPGPRFPHCCVQDCPLIKTPAPLP